MIILEKKEQKVMRRIRIYAIEREGDDNSPIKWLYIKDSKTDLYAIVNRKLIVKLLKTEKFSIKTRPLDSKPAKVCLYGNDYITTEGNKTKEDNLGKLPSIAEIIEKELDSELLEKR